MDMERLQIHIQNAGFKGSILRCDADSCWIELARNKATIIVRPDGSIENGEDDALARAVADFIQQNTD